jgi:protein subunit release factor A
MIPPEDLEFTSYNPWPGGSVAVKVKHLPTGVIAIVQSQRSQFKNKAIAVRMIEAALTDPDFQ